MSFLTQDDVGLLRSNDLLNMILGEFLGEGEHRRVWRCALLPGHVVKVERTASSEKRWFANVHEWSVWVEMSKRKKWAQWLAPCHSISENGLVLIQRECQMLEARPKRVPSFLADLKRANWGLLDGRPVCFDYANHTTFTLVRQNAKMIEAKWHDGKGGWL